MDKDIKIRKITLEDIDDVVKLEESNFSTPWKRVDFEDLTERDDRGCVVAESNQSGRIIGCVVYRNIVGDVDITNVQVDTAFRRQGIARALMIKAMEYARAAGGERFTLEVRASNTPAIALYESLGFMPEGIRPGFYENPHENAVIMWKYI